MLEYKSNEINCTNFFRLNLLNTDSIGQIATSKRISVEYDEKTKSYKDPIRYAASGSLTLTKDLYNLFRYKTDISLEEVIPLVKNINAINEQNKYLLLISPAPINSKFTIYSPVYGFKRKFTVTLNNKQNN